MAPRRSTQGSCSGMGSTARSRMPRCTVPARCDSTVPRRRVSFEGRASSIEEYRPEVSCVSTFVFFGPRKSSKVPSSWKVAAVSIVSPPDLVVLVHGRWESRCRHLHTLQSGSLRSERLPHRRWAVRRCIQQPTSRRGVQEPRPLWRKLECGARLACARDAKMPASLAQEARLAVNQSASPRHCVASRAGGLGIRRARRT